jgi:hypothetical protein
MDASFDRNGTLEKLREPSNVTAKRLCLKARGCRFGNPGLQIEPNSTATRLRQNWRNPFRVERCALAYPGLRQPWALRHNRFAVPQLVGFLKSTHLCPPSDSTYSSASPPGTGMPCTSFRFRKACLSVLMVPPPLPDQKPNTICERSTI